MTRRIDRIHERRQQAAGGAIPPLRTVRDELEAELLHAAATEVQRLHQALGLPRSATLIFGDGEPRIEAPGDVPAAELEAIDQVVRAHFEGSVIGDRSGVKVWRLG